MSMKISMIVFIFLLISGCTTDSATIEQNNRGPNMNKSIDKSLDESLSIELQNRNTTQKMPSTGIQDDEISLFNSHGKPVAYISEDLTIFLWSGKPVAYIYNDSGTLHIYGFNGKHLGWLVKGVIYDHKGYVVGAVREAFVSAVEYEPYKSFKQFEPFKSFKEFAPFQPFLSNHWSDIPLNLFLLQGRE
jgi:hypothetical protein